MLSLLHKSYDLFLTDVDGNIVYSVFKEDDFRTSLLDGKYRGTALASFFNSVRDSRTVKQATFKNFENYAPSNNLPAVLVGSSIIHDGQFVGALMVQLKHSQLNSLIGVGPNSSDATGVYLVGADGFLRAGSGFASDEVLQIVFDHESAEAAL